MRRKLTWLVLLGAAIVVIVEIPVFGANKFVIHVDSNATPDGNGSAKFPYNNLPEAVAVARATSGAVVIKVKPGNYGLAEPLVIDRSLDLRGSTEQVSSDDPWPSGEVAAGTETRIFATSPRVTATRFGRPKRRHRC